MNHTLSSVIEHVNILQKQEETIYKCVDYLSPLYQSLKEREAASRNSPNCARRTKPSVSPMSETWREKICEWCYNIVDYFNYDRELVYVCMNFMDRYVMKRRVDTKSYQLAAMTSLFIVMKIHEPRSSSRQLDVTSLTKLSQSTFNEEMILAMEREMLQTLEWHLFPPTPGRFVFYLSKFFPTRDKIKNSPSSFPSETDLHEISELSRFFTELSVCDYYYVTQNPSAIGYASLLNAIDVVGEQHEEEGEKKFFSEFKQQFSNKVYSQTGLYAMNKDIMNCRARLQATFIRGGFSKQYQKQTCISPTPKGQNNSEENMINESIPSPICISGATI